MDHLNTIFNWCRSRVDFAGEVIKQVDEKQPNIKYTLALLVTYLVLLWGVVPQQLAQFLLMCYGAWCVGQRLDEAGKWIAAKRGK